MWCLLCFIMLFLFFFFKQKTAYELRISYWSSDVCSSDLVANVNANFDLIGFAYRVGRDAQIGITESAVAEAVSERVQRIVADVLIFARVVEIGRAACRERVCQYV